MQRTGRFDLCEFHEKYRAQTFLVVGQVALKGSIRAVQGQPDNQCQEKIYA